MGSREVIEQVAAANDIVDVIGEYFPLQRAGSKFKALSPFTNERTPSFYVDPAKQAYYCFSSQQGGDVFKFIQTYENVSFKEALRKLADRARIHINEEISAEEAAEQKLSRQMREVHRLVAEWYHNLLLKNQAAADAREYLKSRGIGIETAKEWKLGYAPNSSRDFQEWARSHNFSRFLLLKCGLLRESQDGRGDYAHFRHRLMFPIANDYGDTIAFSGRVLSPDQKGGKYVNSPESLIFQKSKTFFGLQKSKRSILQAQQAILCEGQLDVISVYENGVTNVVATLGTAFTEQHARLLRRHTEEVVICYDADRAGLKATNEAFNHLAHAGCIVRVARMPAGEDPDSLIRKNGAEAFRKVASEAEEYFDFQIRTGFDTDGDTVKDRAQLAHRLAEKVAMMQDSLKQELLIDKLAGRLGMSAGEIAKIVKEAKRGQSRERRRSRDDGPEIRSEPVMNLPRWNVMKNLCRLLLTSNEARAFLQKEGDQQILNFVAETELLGYLWEGQADADNPASVSAFLATLPPPVQSAASRLLVEEGEGNDGESAKDCYLAILRRSVENQLLQCKGRMEQVQEKSRRQGIDTAAKAAFVAELTDLLSEYNGLQTKLREMPPPRTKADDYSAPEVMAEAE